MTLIPSAASPAFVRQSRLVIPAVVLTLGLSAIFPLSAIASTEPYWAKAEVADPARININTADAVTLSAALKGVGLEGAKAIVAYRKKVGRFDNVEQLTQVNGIGARVLRRNRARMVL